MRISTPILQYGKDSTGVSQHIWLQFNGRCMECNVFSGLQGQATGQINGLLCGYLKVGIMALDPFQICAWIKNNW